VKDLIEQNIKETVVFTTYSKTGRKLLHFTGKHSYIIQLESCSDLILNLFSIIIPTAHGNSPTLYL